MAGPIAGGVCRGLSVSGRVATGRVSRTVCPGLCAAGRVSRALSPGSRADPLTVGAGHHGNSAAV
ncbi:hypothetical protein GCM10010431_44300 [Streptomyces kunmingensis]